MPPSPAIGTKVSQGKGDPLPEVNSQLTFNPTIANKKDSQIASNNLSNELRPTHDPHLELGKIRGLTIELITW